MFVKSVRRGDEAEFSPTTKYQSRRMETSSSTSRGQHQPRRELGPSPPGCRWRRLWGTARPLSGSRSAPREPGPDAPHLTSGFYWRFSARRRPRQEPGRRASLALQYLPWLRGAQQSWALGIKTRGRASAVLKEVPACSQGLQPAPGLRDGGSGGPGAGRAGRRAGAELGAAPGVCVAPAGLGDLWLGKTQSCAPSSATLGFRGSLAASRMGIPG
ncbi:uncharacterized protein LOC106007031 [Mustela putorius furo]|uniref:Uncharacterized protein LOC106007031 n=1 Tax=Mustela putorius furo TaxID=9669 RepID=A0A8U0TGX1_MUSPF|nr:uncharacterized protein LOC106007031 [Mustela putorius furo]